MTQRIKVYIASPYSIGDKFANVKRSMMVADTLMDHGYIPFMPLLSHFQNEAHPRPYEYWIDYDLTWVEACDVVLRLAGESKGADGEVAYAKEHDIPVVHSLDELNAWRNSLVLTPPGGRPQECQASGAGHRDGPHGMRGETQCAYCGLPPTPERSKLVPVDAVGPLGVRWVGGVDPATNPPTVVIHPYGVALPSEGRDAQQ